MPLVTFTVTRNASYSNYIDFTSQTGSQPFTMGPDAGTVQLDLPEGTTYTLSGRSDQSSTVSWTQLGNQVVGLEDGGDSDYDDLMVYVDIGEFNSVSGNQVTYTASAVSIFTFTASPSTINYGSGSTLSWTSGGGTSASINNGVGAVGLNSSTTVYPTVTTTYTLTVSNDVGNSTTAQVTVNVSNPPPTINSFSASPLAIRRGNSSTFTWTSSNGNTAVIYPESGDNAIGSVNPNGTVTKTLTETTTYQLSVLGTGGQAISGYVTVTVYQPGNLTLSLDANSIVAGQSTTLRWSTTGDVNVITWSSGGITNGNVSSNQTVSPTVTTTYTATVSGNGASDTESVTLTVIQRPVVTAFNANPIAIRRGLSTRLSWAITNATSASINNGIGAVTVPSGFVDVSPTTTTQYVLSVFGEGNTTASANTTVTVYQPPTINTFTTSSASIIQGNSVTLAWTSSNATNASINQGIGAVLPNTSRVVSPTTTTTYRLTVTGLGSDPNVSVYQDVTVIVYQPPVLTLTLDANPITAGNSTTLRWSTTGDANNITWSSGGITNTNLSSYELVSPTVTTTYTATISGLGGTDTKTVTLLVYQIPTVSLTVPTSLLYGQQGTITYSSCYSNTSLVLTPTYSYSNASGSSTVPGTAVYLTRPNSAEIGVGTTCVNNQTITTAIPYNTSGPRSVSYALVAVGSGGNKTVLGSTTIIIDETPDNINIPEIDDVVKSQDPVYTPKATSTITLRVVDIDIPVEIKSNRAIKVEINDDNIWKDVRLM